MPARVAEPSPVLIQPAERGRRPESTAGVVVRIPAHPAHVTHSRNESVLAGARGDTVAEPEAPPAAHPAGKAEALLFRAADECVRAPTLPGVRAVPLVPPGPVLAAGAGVPDPRFDRPFLRAGPQPQLVVVRGTHPELAVAALEPRRGPEARTAAPQRPPGGPQRQLRIAAGVMRLVALAFVEVIERHRVVVRLERPGPVGAHVRASACARYRRTREMRISPIWPKKLPQP